MKKKIKVVGAIAGLGIVLMATLTFAQQPSPQFPQFPFEPPVTGGEQLVDPWGKFQISIPAGALAQNESFNYTIPRAGGGAGIWISIMAMPDPGNFQGYSQQLSAMLQQTGWQIANQTTRQVGQFQAQEFTAQIDNPQMGGKIQMITVAVSQINVLLSVSGPQQDAGRIRSVLDQMLGTLQVAGVPPPIGEGARPRVGPSMQTYTNSLGNYSIFYPPGWNVKEQQYGVAFTSQERAELTLLLVEDQQLLSQGPLAIVYTLEQQVSSQASDYQRLSAVNTQIGQYPGAKLTYTSTCPAGYPEKGMLVGVVTRPQRGYVIFCTAPADHFSQVEATFNQMLSSFREHRRTEKTSRQSNQMVTAIRFKTLKYIDKQEGMGIEAFRMLIPSDWQFEGGIRWVLDNPHLPAVAGFRVGNPEGAEEFEVFPTQAFFWTDNKTVLSMFPIGSRYFGHEVHPLVKPIETLKQIVIPRFRGNVSNLRIVNEKLLPELAEAVGAGTQSQPGVFSSAEGAKIRVEYNLNGIDMEEEIYTVVQSNAFPVLEWGQMRTHINWYVDYIFSFKAEKGKLDANSKTFQTIAYSFKLNPLWFSKFIQVVEYLAKREIKIIKSWGELGRIISQTGSEIRDEDMDRWNRREAAKDKMADEFSQYIRGVEKYYNPIEGKPVELPGGYQNAWTNSLGEYILSDNPNFNPNIGSNINWQPIKKTQ